VLEQIAFTAGSIGNREVYVMAIDGSRVINMTSDSADDWYPAWSPDHQRIAFVSARHGNPEIYVMDINSRAVTRMTHDTADDIHPAWSPDGNRIAFTSDRDGNQEIYLLSVESGGETRLTDNQAQDTHPTWSSDSSRLAFASNSDGDWDIFIINDDGSELVNLTNNKCDDWEPAWSRDGARIAFASDRYGTREICVVDIKDKGVTRLTNNTREDWLPYWTRDGRYVIFLSGPNQEDANVYRIYSNGTGERRISEPIPYITPIAMPSVVHPVDTPTHVVTSTPTNIPVSSPAPEPEPTIVRTPASTLKPTKPAPPTETASPTPRPNNTPILPISSTPMPSPASYFVAYTDYHGPALEGYSVWGMRGDGSEARKLQDVSIAPAFSLDGKKLAFSEWKVGLHVWDFEHQRHETLVEDKNASFATWAPDSTQLAYFTHVGGTGQRWIRLVSAEGLTDHQLTSGMRPSWSPTGDFVAYDSCEGSACGIFRIDLNGTSPWQLTRDGGGAAAVSHDGTKIAYWSEQDGDPDIYVMSIDGTNGQQLTRNRGNDVLPAWSPDSSYIFYLSDRSGQGWAVMRMNADGSNPQKVRNASINPDFGWEHQKIAVTWYEEEIHGRE
jgi:Tol biopolymer transport system component